jgi:hypothetical protein
MTAGIVLLAYRAPIVARQRETAGESRPQAKGPPAFSGPGRREPGGDKEA